MTIINDLTSTVPRAIETGFGSSARHMSFDNALTKISEKLGSPPTFIYYFLHSSRLESKYHAYSVFFSLLKQEVRAYNELLEYIHTVCDDLRRALVGEIVVSEILEETQRTLLMHEIPRTWKVCLTSNLSVRSVFKRR